MYFVLRTQPGSLWKDEESREYRFGTNVPRYSQLIPGVQVIFDRRNSSGELEFTGFARISSVNDIINVVTIC
jgi:hypothetical protein